MSEKPAAQNIPAALNDLYQYKHKTGKKRLDEADRKRSVSCPLTETEIAILDGVAASREQTRADCLRDMVVNNLIMVDNTILMNQMRYKIQVLEASLEQLERVGDKHVKADKA